MDILWGDIPTLWAFRILLLNTISITPDSLKIIKDDFTYLSELMPYSRITRTPLANWAVPLLFGKPHFTPSIPRGPLCTVTTTSLVYISFCFFWAHFTQAPWQPCPAPLMFHLLTHARHELSLEPRGHKLHTQASGHIRTGWPTAWPVGARELVIKWMNPMSSEGQPIAEKPHWWLTTWLPAWHSVGSQLQLPI